MSIPQAIVGGIFPIDGSKHELAAVVGILTILTLLAWTKWRPKATHPCAWRSGGGGPRDGSR